MTEREHTLPYADSCPLMPIRGCIGPGQTKELETESRPPICLAGTQLPDNHHCRPGFTSLIGGG